jgi:hypothetical protein
MKTFSRTLVPVLAAVGAIAASICSAARAQTAAPRSPAPSLVRPASAAKTPNPDGFLQRWLVLEPIRVSGQLTDRAVQDVVKAEYFPNQLTTLPRDGETLTVGETPVAWHAIDTVGYNVNLFHFARALDKPTSNVLFWAVTIVEAPREMRGARLAIGSNAASVWWVNGEEVIGIYNDRQTVIDDGVSKRLTLRKGPNVVRGAIVNGGGATDFCARFLDDKDRPVTGLSVTLTNR